MRRLILLAGLFAIGCSTAPPPKPSSPTVYVVLWFDTEDYLSPNDDEAALHLANFLTAEGIKATFKIVLKTSGRPTVETRSVTVVVPASVR